MRKVWRSVAGLAVVVLAGVYLVSGGDLRGLVEQEILPTITRALGGDESSGSAQPIDEVDPKEISTAVGQLELLEVAELDGGAGYDRDAFGQRWADVDRNGCDQRNDALRAGAVEVVIKPGTHGCVVLEATIADPYTGATIDFVKGENTVDIDHVVPLSRAWQQGAAGWPEEAREEFANTSANLLAVDASVNRSKGDSGPEEWMPEAGRCSYAIRWIAIKAEFALTVTTAEKGALENELNRCEGSAE